MCTPYNFDEIGFANWPSEKAVDRTPLGKVGCSRSMGGDITSSALFLAMISY